MHDEGRFLPGWRIRETDLELRGKNMASIAGATRSIGRGAVELLVTECPSVDVGARDPEDAATAVEAIKRPDVQVVAEAVNVHTGETNKRWRG